MDAGRMQEEEEEEEEENRGYIRPIERILCGQKKERRNAVARLERRIVVEERRKEMESRANGESAATAQGWVRPGALPLFPSHSYT
jgi:hypothetical protein